MKMQVDGGKPFFKNSVTGPSQALRGRHELSEPNLQDTGAWKAWEEAAWVKTCLTGPICRIDLANN